VNGDFVILTSGWSRLTDKVFRVAGSTTNTFELEGADTSDVNIYPAGGGIGSVKKITGWTQLQQVLQTQSQGGEQQFATFQFLEGDREVRIPTTKSGGGLTVNVADDPTLPGFILASKANDDRVERAVRVTTAKGSKILYLSYITIDKTPSMDVNTVMACQATLSHLNEPVRYAA
ncbi:MAG TPA: phage tail protein, partial [Lysobacter sp.]